MKLSMWTLSVGLALSVAVQASAEDAVQREQTRDSWFGAPASEPSDPYETPIAHQPEPLPSPSQRAPNRPTAEQASRAHRRARGPETVPIQFEPDEPSVHLLVQDGMMPFESVVHYDWPGWWGWPYPYGYYRATGVAPIYAPICEGRCISRISRGPHQFALSKPGGPIVPISGQSMITEPSMIRARYIDRGDLRTAGVLVGVIGSLGGLVMMIFSVHDEQHCDGYTCTTQTGVDEALAAAGLGVFAGSIITSAVLISQHDRGQLSIMPLRLSSPDPRIDASHWNHSQLRTEGASLTMHF